MQRAGEKRCGHESKPAARHAGIVSGGDRRFPTEIRRNPLSSLSGLRIVSTRRHSQSRTDAAPHTIDAENLRLEHPLVLFRQFVLPGRPLDGPAPDEHVLGRGREFERIAAPDHDVRVPSGLQRSDAIGDAELLGHRERHSPERRVPREAVGHRVAGFLPDVTNVEGLARAANDDEGHARPGEEPGVLLAGAQRGEARRDVVEGAGEHRHFLGSQAVRHLPRLGAAEDHELQIELAREVERGLDVGRPIHRHDER